MFHPLLQKQFADFLGGLPSADHPLQAFFNSISDTYHQFEKNAGSTEYVEQPNAEKPKPFDDLASFPLENPNPVFRISDLGEILFQNKAGSTFKKLLYKERSYTTEEFFTTFASTFNLGGTFEVNANGRDYHFQNKPLLQKKCINLYGWDITEQIHLQQKAFDNFYRLETFLESTNEAYFIIYEKHKEKSFFTSKWGQFFGFNPIRNKDVFKERRKLIPKDALADYDEAIRSLEKEGHTSLQYPIQHKQTKEIIWLDEKIIKHFDPITHDSIISGRIIDITKERLYSMHVKESEERFKLIMDAAPVMILVTDKNNHITYTNKALTEKTGISTESISTDEEIAALLHPEDKPIVLQSWKKQKVHQQITISNYRLQNKMGEYLNISEESVPRFYEDGAFAGNIKVYIDLTKENTLIRRLNLKQNKLDIVTKHSPDIILLINTSGIIEYVSESVERILGYPVAEVQGSSIERYMSSDYSTHFKASILKSKINNKGAFQEYQMEKINGENIWVESSVSRIQGVNKDEVKLLIHNRDISEFKKVQQTHEENEQKYKRLFENMQLGVMEVDLEENITWVNKSYEKITGYHFDELNGKNALQLFLPNDQELKKMNSVNKTRKKKKQSTYETKIKRKDGTIIDLVISGAPVVNKAGDVTGSVGIHWDVSSLRIMEHQLAEEKMMRQHHIMEAKLNAEERQKQLLGRELHDSVGQMLTYTSLYLQVAASKEYDPNIFLKAQESILATLNEVRRISRSLVPPALSDLGLKEAIEEFLNQYSELSKPMFRFQAKDNVFQGISYESQIMIYRIIQELTSNTLRYANAQTVDVSFSRSDRFLSIRYSDDGRGFESDKIKKGVGLNSIKTRTAYFNGNFDIQSNKNMGAVFTIELPLETITNEEQEN
ncbi:MAG: PAS domain S-box protein [Chitinophagaceae bacterium]